MFLTKSVPKGSCFTFCSCSSPKPWAGLQKWRESPVNQKLVWGPNGPKVEAEAEAEQSIKEIKGSIWSASCLSELGAVVLSTADPLTKSRVSHLAFTRWVTENLPVGACDPPPRPARPSKPQLVSPKDIPGPKQSGLPLNAYMLHNLAHVELNAIDLAWDTVVRFSPFHHLLGDAFFADFARVADDESRHFSWCSHRLAELGFRYGDMPAHNLLWRECEKSSDSVAARLAVIPMVQILLCRIGSVSTDESTVQEARGLDAGPRLVQKLIGFGDNMTSKLVSTIADEELAHVAVGVYWFVSVCEKLNQPPSSTFKDLLREYDVELKGPFNYPARDEAGIPRDWYDSYTNNGGKQDNIEKLSVVHDRLAHIISMETESSSLGS